MISNSMKGRFRFIEKLKKNKKNKSRRIFSLKKKALDPRKTTLENDQLIKNTVCQWTWRREAVQTCHALWTPRTSYMTQRHHIGWVKTNMFVDFRRHIIIFERNVPNNLQLMRRPSWGREVTAVATVSTGSLEAYSQWSRLTPFDGRRPCGAVLHSPNKSGELSHWLCHDDSSSTINIAFIIILIIIVIIPCLSVQLIHVTVYHLRINSESIVERISVQEKKAALLKSCNAAAVLFGLKFSDSIHHKFKSSQPLKARLQSSKHTGAKQIYRKMAIQGHSRSHILESVERRSGTK